MTSPAPIRFLESLDSVRYRGNPPIEAPTHAPTHALVEIVFSMLFGEPVAVPQAYSFDSTGFLEASSAVLSKRPPSYSKTPVWDPFVLGRVVDHPYRTIISTYLRQEQRRFVLSGWPEIDEDDQVRADLADLVEKGQFSEAVRRYPQCRRQLERADVLDGYFKPANVETVPLSNIALEDYLDWLERASPDVLGERYEETVRSLQGGLANLDAAGISRSDRSDVWDWGAEHVSEEVLRGLLEYVDTCYNATLCDSLEARTAIWSTMSQQMDVHELVGQDLAFTAMNELEALNSQDSPKVRNAVSADVNPLAIWMERGPELTELLLPVATNCIDEVWTLVTKADEWSASVEQLHDSLDQGDRQQAIDALDSHIENLASWLSFMDSERGKLTMSLSTAVLGSGSSAALQYILEEPSLMEVGGAAAAGAAGGFLLGWSIQSALDKSSSYRSKGIRQRILRSSIELFEAG